MRQRYNKAFAALDKKNQGALVPFTVVGDPDMKTSIEIIQGMIDAGADILELGVPFSDPIADGSTIQQADVRALKKGFSMDGFFRAIKEIRSCNENIPIGILVYSNLVLQRGIDNFYRDAIDSGIDSVLVADVPIEESGPFEKAAQENKIDTVFTVTPLTPNERIRLIQDRTTGFIYAVSRLGVTGAQKKVHPDAFTLIGRIKAQSGKKCLVGFGISTPGHVKHLIHAGADGVIVGSRIVGIIGKSHKTPSKMIKEIRQVVSSLKQATSKKS